MVIDRPAFAFFGGRASRHRPGTAPARTGSATGILDTGVWHSRGMRTRLSTTVAAELMETATAR